MHNRLGLSSSRIVEVEKQIVNLKLNLLDEYFTFNRIKMDFEYLKRIHKYLFLDLYYDFQIGNRILSKEEKNIIENMLSSINEICIYEPENIDKILNIVQKLWEIQPFYDGNTRTLLAYLKILNSIFSLGLNIDINKDIISKSSFFDTNNFVNQKRLTKIK